MTEITFENFREEISLSEKPVLLAFYNQEVPQNLSYIEALDAMHLPNIYICKTDTQNGGAAFAALYGVLATPTLLLLKNGKEIARYCGLAKKEAVLSFLKDIL